MARMNATSEQTVPREEPIWSRLWAVVVFVLVLLEVIFFEGVPASSDGAAWSETRGPLILVGTGVLSLLLLAAIQAKWGKSGAWKGGRLGLGSCPAWFEYAAVGLATVGIVVYVYAAFRSLGSDGAVHVTVRRAGFLLLMGSSVYFELIPALSRRRRATAKDQPA